MVPLSLLYGSSIENVENGYPMLRKYVDCERNEP